MDPLGFIRWFPKLGVPCWGPQYKGILLFADPCWGSPIFVSPSKLRVSGFGLLMEVGWCVKVSGVFCGMSELL